MWPFAPSANTTAEISVQPTTRLSCAYHGWKAPRCTSRRTPAFAATNVAAKPSMNHNELGTTPSARTTTSSAMPKPKKPHAGVVPHEPRGEAEHKTQRDRNDAKRADDDEQHDAEADEAPARAGIRQHVLALFGALLLEELLLETGRDHMRNR